MTDDDRATIAEFEIFSGKFDHWGHVSEADHRYECGVDPCDLRVRALTDPVGAFRRHLSGEHLGTVIEAMGQRP